MKSSFKMIFISLLAVFLTACSGHHVHGNGKFSTKSRSLPDFNHIVVSGNYQLKIDIGENQSLDITTDSNIDPLIMTRVRENTLHIATLQGYSFSSSRPVIITLHMQSLKDIKSAGDNSIIIKGIANDNFALTMNGSGDADLSGNTTDFYLTTAGSGSVDASKLLAKNVKIEIVGSGDAKVNASTTLSYKIVGAGRLSYIGSPKITASKIQGVGNVTPIE